jgi:hypothetical protein
MLRHLIGALCLLMVALGVLLAAPAAQAQTLDVTAVPNTFRVSAVAPTNVVVTWRVVRVVSAVGTVSSPRAVLSVGGTTVATLGNPLSRAVGLGAVTSTFTESLLIPQEAVYRAVKSGVPLILSRTFDDGAGGAPPDTGSATLIPSGPGSEVLSVTRLDLKFDDQTRVKVTPKGSRLRAIAELNTTGQGIIQGTWEVALSPTTRGGAVFRPFGAVRQPVAGRRRVVITSPPLPTRFEGTNIVRLRITDPVPGFDEPEIQFYITPESPLPEDVVPGLMLVTSPSPGTPLTLTTRFAWQAVPGAHLYKIEVFDAPPTPGEVLAQEQLEPPAAFGPLVDTDGTAGLRPLTGAVVPGTQTEIRLKDFSLAHLPPDRRYQWSVKAVDQNGAVLGVSPPREIYKP